MCLGVRPEVVAQVEFPEWTEGDHLSAAPEHPYIVADGSQAARAFLTSLTGYLGEQSGAAVEPSGPSRSNSNRAYASSQDYQSVALEPKDAKTRIRTRSSE
jgi:hypothetical protein